MRERLPFFFGSLAFCYIHHGAGEFSKIAGIVENRMTYDMDVLDSPIGHQQSMLKIERHPVLRCMIDYLLNTPSVEGMSALEYQIYGRLVSPGVFEDAKAFFRPVEFSAGNIPTETARCG